MNLAILPPLSSLQCHPKDASCQKIEKVTEAFLRLALPPLKVAAAADDADDDDDDDDGRVGI